LHRKLGALLLLMPNVKNFWIWGHPMPKKT
jgi:hypothetical protein